MLIMILCRSWARSKKPPPYEEELNTLPMYSETIIDYLPTYEQSISQPVQLQVVQL